MNSETSNNQQVFVIDGSTGFSTGTSSAVPRRRIKVSSMLTPGNMRKNEENLGQKFFFVLTKFNKLCLFTFHEHFSRAKNFFCAFLLKKHLITNFVRFPKYFPFSIQRNEPQRVCVVCIFTQAITIQ